MMKERITNQQRLLIIIIWTGLLCLWTWREYYWTEDDDIEPPPQVAVPAIIQFSLIANADQGFNGIDLVNAFGIVGLEYGNLKIYERLDANRLVDFGVACMVEPGTFPNNDLDTFYCPGLVFFMQPGALDDAQAVFDDYLDTIQLLAIELDGTIRDNNRQPLTDATVQNNSAEPVNFILKVISKNK